MSQSPDETCRKVVLVFSSPTVSESNCPSNKPIASNKLIDALDYLAKRFGWKLEASHTVSVDAKIQVLDGPET